MQNTPKTVFLRQQGEFCHGNASEGTALGEFCDGVGEGDLRVRFGPNRDWL